MTPRFGPNGDAATPADEEVWVDWTFALSRDHKEAFETDSDRTATAVALDTLRAIVTDIDQARSCVP